MKLSEKIKIIDAYIYEHRELYDTGILEKMNEIKRYSKKYNNTEDPYRAQFHEAIVYLLTEIKNIIKSYQFQ